MTRVASSSEVELQPFAMRRRASMMSPMEIGRSEIARTSQIDVTAGGTAAGNGSNSNRSKIGKLGAVSKNLVMRITK